jgi:transcription-repair coupling factor (superfamily II helicase)
MGKDGCRASSGAVGSGKLSQAGHGSGGWLQDEFFWDGVLSDLLDSVASRPDTRAGGLGGASVSLAVAALHRVAGPTLVVAPSIREAESIRDDLRGILGDSLYFPPYETLPYEGEPAHKGVVSDRIECMSGLLAASPKTIVVVPAQALLKRLPPLSAFESFRVFRGMRLDPERLASWLVGAGYEREDTVAEQGIWASRGGVTDVGTFGMDNPVRIEFFGDEVESVRVFDQRSQRSVREIQSAVLLPAREAVLHPEMWDRAMELVPPGTDLYEKMLNSNTFPGMEHHLPLFMEGLTTLTDYLPSIGTLVLVEPVRSRESLQAAWESQIGSFPENSGFPAEAQFASPAELVAKLKSCQRIASFELLPAGDVDVYIHTLPQESYVGHPEEMLRQFRAWASEGYRISVACDSPAEKEAFLTLIPPDLPVEVDVLPLSEGFRMPEKGLIVLSERKLLSGRRRPGGIRRFRGGEPVAVEDDLAPGQLVVHRQYGIGLFKGLERVSTGGETLDCLTIEYADGDRLLVPTAEISHVHLYRAPGDGSPQLDRIGTSFWSGRVSRARAKASEVAGRLAVLYAERKARQRPPLPPASHLMEALEHTFPFEETPDQAGAIDRLKRDLIQPLPMDRLVCGDVGYGKTEVALRAAFRVADTGAQVAVLVPTTILAEQHFQTFRDRLAEFPVKVAVLSRFQTPAEQREVLSGLADGSTGIVVGTHRLLQKDVRFHRLGLVVVDEEHRFGVRQKEYLRELRTSVDTLSMTATPIPRTLHMALSGFRDISLIATPPRDRYPIHTELISPNRKIIATAVQRELEREGQIFFVHNRIATLGEVRGELSSYLGNVRICTAHGQMKAEALEDVMHAFIEGEYDMLLCTAIIESGLDMPRVNTIFIDDAQTFGVADLYQLRGRVGRSYHRAYCYFIHPPGPHGLSPEARNRLESISRFRELGSGWHVAMRDLETRGAGELLGARQHGHMESIGYALFEELIAEEVASLRGTPSGPPLAARIELPGESFLPEDYMPDIVERVRLYRAVWRSLSETQVDDWKSFVRDRFGEMPDPAVNCAERARIRLLAAEAGAEEVVGSGKSVRIVLGPGRLSVAEAQRRLQGVPLQSCTQEKTGRLLLLLDCTSQGQPGQLEGVSDALRSLR